MRSMFSNARLKGLSLCIYFIHRPLFPHVLSPRKLSNSLKHCWGQIWTFICSPDATKGILPVNPDYYQSSFRKNHPDVSLCYRLDRANPFTGSTLHPPNWGLTRVRGLYHEPTKLGSFSLSFSYLFVFTTGSLYLIHLLHSFISHDRQAF